MDTNIRFSHQCFHHTRICHHQRDEDFDTSYESLLALSATLGEVKPKATPANVIAALPTGLYKEWQSAEADKRCPICLDDVCVFSSFSFVVVGWNADEADGH